MVKMESNKRKPVTFTSPPALSATFCTCQPSIIVVHRCECGFSRLTVAFYWLYSFTLLPVQKERTFFVALTFCFGSPTPPPASIIYLCEGLAMIQACMIPSNSRVSLLFVIVNGTAHSALRATVSYIDLHTHG